MSESNQQFDLVHDLQVQLKWQPSFAKAAKEEYMRWLRLRADAGDFVSCKLPPSRVVAMVWNIHRQWTLDYDNTCRELGGFIHHYPPAMRMDFECEQAYAATIHNYKHMYNRDPPSQYWGPPICPYKPIGDDDLPAKETKSSHPTGRRTSTKRESARNHHSAKIATRQSDVTTRRNSEIITTPTSNQRDRNNSTQTPSSRRKSTKISKTPLASNTKDTTNDNDLNRNGTKRRRFPGSSPHFVLKPLGPGEKRKRGRPSFSDYILADDAPPSTPLPKKKDMKPGASEKLLSPRTPVSTRSLGRRRSTTSTRASASIIKKEKSKPMRRVGRASSAASTPNAVRASASKSKTQVAESEEIDVASTLPKDVVLEHVVKRPRGRPRKDGSWPTQRSSRKNDPAAKAAIARAAVSKLALKVAAAKGTPAKDLSSDLAKATTSTDTVAKAASNASKTVAMGSKGSAAAKNSGDVKAVQEIANKKPDNTIPPLSGAPLAEPVAGLPAVQPSISANNEKSAAKSQPGHDPAKTSAVPIVSNTSSVPVPGISTASVKGTTSVAKSASNIAPATTLPPVPSGSPQAQVANRASMSGPNSKDVVMADIPFNNGIPSRSPGKAIDTSDMRMQDLSDKEQSKTQTTSDHTSRDPVFDQIIDSAPLTSKDRSADVASGLLPKNVPVGQDVVFPQPGAMNNPVDMDMSMPGVQRQDSLPSVIGSQGNLGIPTQPTNDKLLSQGRVFPMTGMTVNPINPPNPLGNPMEGSMLPLGAGGLLSKPDVGASKEGITGAVGNAEPRPQIKRPRGRPRKEAAWPSNRPKALGEDGVDRPKDVNDPSQALNFPMGPSGTV